MDNLEYHESIRDVIDDFRLQITATAYLIANIDQAGRYFRIDHDIIKLPCSVAARDGKFPDVIIDRNILEIIRGGGHNGNPMFKDAFVRLSRMFTIAVKDIIWEECGSRGFTARPELQFLRHLRNACAHNNLFFWGSGPRQRQQTINQMPIVWREKVIVPDLEGSALYFVFFKPGDILVLLADISALLI